MMNDFRVDRNKDGELSAQEVSNWIYIRVRDHIDTAIRQNVFIFTKIDRNPRNGKFQIMIK